MPRRGTDALPQTTLAVLGGMCLLVAILYWAQTVLMPVALAILLSAALTPIVGVLQRRGLRRLPAVVVVIVVTFLFILSLISGLTAEMQQIAEDLPTYEKNLQEKLEYFKGGQPGLIDKLSNVIDRLSPKDDNPKRDPAYGIIAFPVRVVQEQSTGWSLFPLLALPAGVALGRISLVIGLTVSMLVKREDLRNRFIRLAGSGRLTKTTRALEEATQLISRYLLVQTTLNLGFGALFGLGLTILGIPYGLLWGVLAAVLRFVPYVGTWMGAAVPVILSFAVFDGWSRPFLVVGLALVLGLTANYAIEPRLISHSTGVSPFALVVSAAFWTWLWGPVGLVLSTPMTVCLGVLGRHVPQLHFLSTLLSTEPALGPQYGYYQRLLAHDEAEAAELLETYLETHPREELYDEVLLPTLARARQDEERDDLDDEDVSYIVQTTRELLEELAEEAAKEEETEKVVAGADGAAVEPPTPVLVLGLPARDEVDELALWLFKRSLDETKVRFEAAGSKTVTAEMVQRVVKEQPALAFIAVVPPAGQAQVRYLCKRLRTRLPKLTILVGCWGVPEEAEQWVNLLRAAGANEVALTLRDSVNQLTPYISVAAGG